MTILEALIGSFIVAWTTHALLLVWFQGSLFIRARAWLEARREIRWWAKLLTCSLCFSVWVTGIFVLALVMPWYLYTHSAIDLLILPFWWGSGLCLARAINQQWTVNPAEE